MPISGVYNLWLLINWFLPLACLPQNMFKVEKVNCICVDWESGARALYSQAVQNTRVVGAEIAFFIQNLLVKPCLGHILWVAGREGGTQAPPPLYLRGSLRTPGLGRGLEAQGGPFLR